MCQRPFLNYAVAALLVLLPCSLTAQEEKTRLDELFDQLLIEDLPNWEIVQQEIMLEWSRSGSPTMDLLLRRGRDALEAGNTELAIEHLTALTDHAPGHHLIEGAEEASQRWPGDRATCAKR